MQDGVRHLMDNVTAKNEDGSDEVIVEAAKGIQRDIKELLRCDQACYNLYYEIC